MLANRLSADPSAIRPSHLTAPADKKVTADALRLTRKIGNDPAAVVNDRLRVHVWEALRVVDASIMPTITSGNTNSPTIMIAEKASGMIVADRRGTS